MWIPFGVLDAEKTLFKTPASRTGLTGDKEANKECRKAVRAMNQSPSLDAPGGNTIMTDDRSIDFHALGLAGCIDKLTTPLRTTGTSVQWETPHHGIEIPAACATLLYHAAEETLRNTFKYAHATELTLRLAAVYHGIRLHITDNGLGFDSQCPTGKQSGYGLRLMTIAVHEAGGNIVVDSRPGNGTRVTITLPLD
jgi:signal transduction histidine kinase